MLSGIFAVISVILRFAFLFGIYFLVKGLVFLSGRRFPGKSNTVMPEKTRKEWTVGEGKVCLYWGAVLILTSIILTVLKTITYGVSLVFCILLAAGLVQRVRNNIHYL